MGRLPGVYRASVMSAMDPAGQGRVQIRVSSAFAGANLWAPACVAGNANGAYMVGDTVVVGFEGGDLDHPIVLGKLP